MNAKFVFAVFLALQVSLTLCEIPAPDPEVVQTYNDIKASANRRAMAAYEKLKKALEPLMETASTHEHTQGAREAIENLHSKPEMEVAKQLVQAIVNEASPAVDKVRTAVLGIYSHYLRPCIGEYLRDAITHVQGVLDQVLPVEN